MPNNGCKGGQAGPLRFLVLAFRRCQIARPKTTMRRQRKGRLFKEWESLAELPLPTPCKSQVLVLSLRFEPCLRY